MDKEKSEKIKKLIEESPLKIDDSSLKDNFKKKTTIKPSQKELDEIKVLWEKFHKELLDKIEKKSG
jgi:restriction endonuclease